MKRVRFVIGFLLAVAWMAPLSAQQPSGTIRGRVTDDATHEPLAGVTVAVGSRGAMTQADGRYVITGVPVGPGVLRARMLGYAPATKNVNVGTGETITVDLTMTAQAVGLSEMVVVGYGEQAKGDATSAMSHLTSEDFNPGRIISPGQLIESKVAGVQVVDNNEPGGGLAIRIRGATSVTASSDPLYVIDGMPVGTGAGGGLSAGRDPLNFLNPNDIASITVLKDASAAAIYGANAANGVVMITTKSGRGGPRIEYSGSMSSSSVTKLPSMLDAAQFRAAVIAYTDTAHQNQLRNANTDWLGLIGRSAFGQEHNLNVSGMGASNSYRFSFGYLNQDGVIRGSSTERISLGFNYDQRLFADRLDVKANIKGSRAFDRFTPGGVLGNAAQYGPTQPVYDSTKTTGYYNWPNNTLTSPDNPIEILNLAKSEGTTYRSVGNLQADYSMPFFPALRANVNLGYDVTQVNSDWFNPSTLHNELKQGFGGEVSHSNPSQANTVFEGYLNYSAPLNVLPGNVDVTGGYSYAQSHQESPSVYERGLATDLLGTSGMPSASTIQNFLDVQDSKLISFFGRVNYNYNDRYLAAFSIRRDGSSRFAPDRQWGNFPAFSVAWRISQEPFLSSVTALSDLKLRASWAATGNQNFGNYLQNTTFLAGNAQAQAQFGNTFVSTIRPSAVDPNIKWEQTSSSNFGVDFGFSGQRFSGSIDWYTKKTSDLIFYVPIAAGTNLSNFLTTNIGSMKNSGIELTLNAKLIQPRGRGLGWTADFTAAHNANTLTSITPYGGTSQQILTGNIAGGVGSTIQVLEPGQPINSFFVLQQKYANGKPVYSDTLTKMYVDQPTVLDTIVCRGTGAQAAGCVGLYRPDGIINSSDKRAYHDPAPKWTLGHSSYLTYGNFDLSFTLRAWLGNYVYNNVASNTGNYRQLYAGNSPYNLSSDVLKTGFVQPQYLSDYYVQDGSFLRMDNITLGYSFQYRGQQLRLYAVVQNAFTITGYKGVDPTAGLNGIDNNIYPRSRTVTGGLSVRF